MKKKLTKKLTSVIAIALVIVFTLSGCGGNSNSSAGESTADAQKTESTQAAQQTEATSESAQQAEATSESAQQAEAAPVSGEFRNDYKFGQNALGTGVVWMLDKFVFETEWFVRDYLGMEISSPSANFEASQIQIDCQNLIQSGIDAMLYYGAYDTLTPTISEMFEKAQIPFAMPHQAPSAEVLELLRQNPYFVGCICTNFYEDGYNVAMNAINAGYKKLLFVRGAVGQISQDEQERGVRQACEDNGVELVGVAVCATADEAVDKCKDLFAAYGDQADSLVAINKSFLDGAVAAMESFGYDFTQFTEDIDYTALDPVREGKLIASGGCQGYFALTAALLLNYLDGHPILDENGQAPYIEKSFNFPVTKETVDEYEENWINGHIYSDAVWQKLLYRYNPDVTYEDWKEFIDNVSIEYLRDNYK